MVQVRPVRRRSIPDEIAAQLEEEILSGRIAPGERLPPERELAAQLGTNRNTLREALRHLQTLRLIEARQGAGITVRDFRAEGEPQLLTAFFEHGPDPAEKLQVLGDVLLLREALAELVVPLVVERATGEDLAGLRAHVLAQRGHTKQGDLARGDLAFLHALIRATRSLVVIWTYNSFAGVLESFLDRFPHLWVQPPGYQENLEAILAALEARDAEAAVACMATHLRSSEELVLERLAEGGKETS